MTSAIIVAAGSGTRMGFDKLLASLGGVPVILHTLRAFQTCLEVDEIVVVASPDRQEVIQRLAEDLTGLLLTRDPLSDNVHHSKPRAAWLALGAVLANRRRA